MQVPLVPLRHAGQVLLKQEEERKKIPPKKGEALSQGGSSREGEVTKKCAWR